MARNLLDSLKFFAAMFALLALASCGGGGGGGGGSGANSTPGGTISSGGLTISGKVYDLSTSSAAAISGVAVSLRNAAGITLATATSSSDGSYTLVNVPASTEVYFSASKSGFVSTHSSLQTFIANDTFFPFVVSPATAKASADAISGTIISSAWSDAAYQTQAWFGIDAESASGNDTPGMSVVPAIADSTLKYNDGTDRFHSLPPTISSLDQPLAGGFSSTERVHVFSTNFGQTIKLPLFKGAISYAHQLLVGRSLVWASVTSATPNTLFGIAASNAMAVAVGSLGTIIASPDGSTWANRTSGINVNLNGVASSGALFVAVGDTGTIITSSDSVSWTAQNSRTSNRLRSVAWTGTQFIAVGDAGTIVTSADSVNWSVQNSGTSSILFSVAGFNGQNVVVGSPGTILTSPTGVTWTSRTSANQTGLNTVVWSGTQFLIGGDDGNSSAISTLQTSFDGITWTSQTPKTYNTVAASAWSGAQFVTVGTVSSMQTSADGIGWNSLITDGTNLNGVTFFKGRFFAVGASGRIFSGSLDTSSNGDVLFNALNSATSNASQLVAVGALGTVVASRDGTSFSTAASKVNVHLNGVATSGSRFVAVGDDGTIISSPDLVTWTRQISGTKKRLRAVTWTGTQFISVGDGGTILTSPDGGIWSAQVSGVTHDLYAVAGYATQNVAVGASGTAVNGTILSSPTGVAWTNRSSISYLYIPVGLPFGATPFPGNTLHSIIWSGNQFLIGGDVAPNVLQKTIQTSFDGINWTAQSAALTNTVNAAAWSGSKFVTVGTAGVVQSSPDGISWAQVTFGSSQLNGVTYFKGNFYAVGNAGTILSVP